MSNKPTFARLRVLLQPERNGYWTAQALEVDIVAQGRNMAEAKSAFVKTIVGHVVFALKMNRIPFDGIGKAPRSLWNLFEKGAKLSDPIRIPAAAQRKFRHTAPVLSEAMLARVA
jgi:hypothetical protein